MLVIKQTQTIVAQVLSRNNSVYLRTLQFMGAINKYNLVKNKATKNHKIIFCLPRPDSRFLQYHRSQ